MTATIDRRSRVASRLDQPNPLSVPVTPAGRREAYAEAVMMALLTLQAQLRHPDAKIARDAAIAIVDLEKTRLRHGEPVAGTHAPSEVLEPLGDLPPLTRPRAVDPNPLAERAEHSPNLADPFEAFVEQVRQVHQSWEDEDGFDITIRRADARRWAAEQIANERKRRAGEPIPPPDDPRLIPPDELVEAGSAPLAPRVGSN